MMVTGSPEVCDTAFMIGLLLYCIAALDIAPHLGQYQAARPASPDFRTFRQ